MISALVLAALLSSADTSTATADAVPAAVEAPAYETPEARVLRLRKLYEALQAFDVGEYPRCENLALGVIEKAPADTMAMILAGAARMRQKNFTGAAQVFGLYAERHPLDAYGYFALGLAHHLAGSRDEAVKAYWTALLVDPGMTAARENMRQLDAARP